MGTTGGIERRRRERPVDVALKFARDDFVVFVAIFATEEKLIRLLLTLAIEQLQII